MTFDAAVALLDWFGVVVFAVSGALVASRKGMDVAGFALLGVATGIGGGTLRDVLLGALPVFWVREPAYLLACVAASVVVFLTAPVAQSRYRLLLWFDAAGLALFAITGAERALLAGAGPVIAVAMGVVTATFGGVVRDVLGGESPVVLSREVYVVAAMLGAAAFVGGSLLLPREVAMGAGLAAAFGLRGVALHRGWSLPRYKARQPGPDDRTR